MGTSHEPWHAQLCSCSSALSSSLCSAWQAVPQLCSRLQCLAPPVPSFLLYLGSASLHCEALPRVPHGLDGSCQTPLTYCQNQV